jgi:hypothetical protein
MNSIISHVLFIQGYTLCYFMLDLLLVNNTEATSGVNFVRNITVHPLCFSDHSLVFCQLADNRDQPTTVTRSYRRIKNVNQAAFSHDVTRSRLYDPEVIAIYSVDEYANLFDSEVSRIIDLHAPLLTSTKRQGTHDHHDLSEEAHDAKRGFRRTERRFRKTQSHSDKAALKTARKVMREKIDESRTTWLKDKVRSAAGDPKTLWRTAKQVLHTTKFDMLNEDDCFSLCVKHCFFFSDKVNRVHSTAAAVVNNCSVPADKQHNGEEMNSFDDVSVFEVLKLIAQLPNKSSPRDTLPTPLLK